MDPADLAKPDYTENEFLSLGTMTPNPSGLWCISMAKIGIILG